MASRRCLDHLLTLRCAPETLRAWRDVRSLALLLARHRGERHPCRQGSATAAVLARRAFVRLRSSLLELCRLEGIPAASIDAVLMPAPGQRPEDRARREAIQAAPPAAAEVDTPPAASEAAPLEGPPARLRGRVRWHRDG